MNIVHFQILHTGLLTEFVASGRGEGKVGALSRNLKRYLVPRCETLFLFLLCIKTDNFENMNP